MEYITIIMSFLQPIVTGIIVNTIIMSVSRYMFHTFDLETRIDDLARMTQKRRNVRGMLDKMEKIMEDLKKIVKRGKSEDPDEPNDSNKPDNDK